MKNKNAEKAYFKIYEQGENSFLVGYEQGYAARIAEEGELATKINALEFEVDILERLIKEKFTKQQ